MRVLAVTVDFHDGADAATEQRPRTARWVADFVASDADLIAYLQLGH
jgi:hypothetical protein